MAVSGSRLLLVHTEMQRKSSTEWTTWDTGGSLVADHQD